MMKQKTPYNTKGTTDGILYFQSLINKQSYDWTTQLDDKAVRFIYDMVSQANSFADFIPTAGQSKWIFALVSKIRLVEKSTLPIKKTKKVSPITSAKRIAKEYLSKE